MLDMLVLGALGGAGWLLHQASRGNQRDLPHQQRASVEQGGVPWVMDNITPGGTVQRFRHFNFYNSGANQRIPTQLDPIYAPGSVPERVLGNMAIRPNASINARVSSLRADSDFADELEGPPALRLDRHSPDGVGFDPKYTKHTVVKAGLDTAFSNYINMLNRGERGGTWNLGWAQRRAADPDDDFILNAREDPRFRVRGVGVGAGGA